MELQILVRTTSIKTKSILELQINLRMALIACPHNYG